MSWMINIGILNIETSQLKKKWELRHKYEFFY